MARQLWESLPEVYRQCAVCYTDYWDAYGCVLPKTRHRAVGKESGQSSHIERLNNTLRQRMSRLVRKALSFSKKLAAREPSRGAALLPASLQLLSRSLIITLHLYQEG